MKPRSKWIGIALMLLIVCGLLLGGPVHHSLHGHDGHGDLRADGSADQCDGCMLSSLESPTPFSLGLCAPSGPEREDLQLVRVPNAQPPLSHSPRGPPARA